MTTDPPIKRGRGRPAAEPDAELVSGSLRLTRPDWDKFYAVGGVKWLRDALHRAKPLREPPRIDE